jgi:methionine-rich copper-binding protein CopC
MKGLSRNLFLASLLAIAPLAFAHTHPTAMMPAADSTVSSPEMIMIHFSEPLEPKFSSISVTDSGGHVVNKEASACAQDAKSMSLKLPALKPGAYTVNWVGVATDTHRSQGDYKFTVK